MTSYSALQLAVDRFKEPEVTQGFQQISLINPSISEMITAAQKVSNNITASAFTTLINLSIQDRSKPKIK